MQGKPTVTKDGPRGLAKLWARDSALEIVRNSRTLELLMSIRKKEVHTAKIHCTRESVNVFVPARCVVTLWSVCYAVAVGIGQESKAGDCGDHVFPVCPHTLGTLIDPVSMH